MNTSIKKLAVALAVVSTLGVATVAKADSVYQLDETFLSGATFSGDVTFNNTFDNLTAVNGTLSGAGYGTQQMTWIWNPASNFAGGNGFGGNFLMNGSPSGYTYWVTMTWDYTQAPVLTLTGNSVGYGNNVNYGDPSVSGSLKPLAVAAVPEPETYGMMLAGLGLMGFIARRKKSA